MSSKSKSEAEAWVMAGESVSGVLAWDMAFQIRPERYLAITEGHPTDMELAAKTGADKTDAEIEALAKTLTVWDLYTLFRYTELKADNPKYFARWYRISQAWKRHG